MFEGAATIEDTHAAARRWIERHAEREELWLPIYRSALHAFLGGAYMVARFEAPEVFARRHAAAAARSRMPFFLVPFEEAIAFFLGRRIVSPDEYRAYDDRARMRAFSVTRYTLDELVRRAYRGLSATLRDGGTLEDFVQRMRDAEITFGVEPQAPHYLETVFRTNVQTAYGAGRWEMARRPEVLAARPYVEYRTVGDDRVRPTHAGLDGRVFRQDDPGWPRLAPPNGFNCRCAFVTLAREDVRGRRISRATAMPDPDEGFAAPPEL